MILMLTLLVFSFMHMLHLYSKANGKMYVHHQQLYQLEKAADDIFKLQYGYSQCITQDEGYQNAIKAVQQTPCFYNLNPYQFIISNLGYYPCLQIKKDTHYYGSHHWLITVFDKKIGILQVRMAVPEKGNFCETESRVITSGRLSWRFLVRDQQNGINTP